jgi:hypothetical protein
MLDWAEFFKALVRFIKSVSEKNIITKNVYIDDVFSELDEFHNSAIIIRDYFQDIIINHKYEGLEECNNISFEEILNVTKEIISDKYILIEKAEDFKKSLKLKNEFMKRLLNDADNLKVKQAMEKIRKAVLRKNDLSLHLHLKHLIIIIKQLKKSKIKSRYYSMMIL